MRRIYYTPDPKYRELTGAERESLIRKIKKARGELDVCQADLVRWLIGQGYRIDVCEMSMYMNGTKVGIKCDETLQRCMELLDEYEKKKEA